MNIILLNTLIGLSIGNFLYCLLTKKSYAFAIQVTFSQAIPLAIVFF